MDPRSIHVEAEDFFKFFHIFKVNVGHDVWKRKPCVLANWNLSIYENLKANRVLEICSALSPSGTSRHLHSFET